MVLEGGGGEEFDWWCHFSCYRTEQESKRVLVVCLKIEGEVFCVKEGAMATGMVSSAEVLGSRLLREVKEEEGSLEDVSF